MEKRSRGATSVKTIKVPVLEYPAVPAYPYYPWYGYYAWPYGYYYSPY